MSIPLAFTRTAYDIVAEVMMTRSAFGGAIILLEGPTDSRFFRRHLLQGAAQIVICGGKLTALAAMTQMSGMTLTGYLSVVDRDFDDYKSVNLPQDMFYTDTHDIETLLLSYRLDTVIAELADTSKLEAFLSAHAVPSIADALLLRTEMFSKLRFLSDVKPAMGISMEAFSPWKYTDLHTWDVDETRLHHDFCNTCQHTQHQLMTLISTIPSLNHWIGARGHDALAILSIGLRQVLGAGKQVTENHLASALRLAFDEVDFRSTQLYGSLQNWEQSNGLPLLAH